MLTFNPRTVAKEQALATRALELFLSIQGLAWADAYSLAAYERTALPVRFQEVVRRIGQGMTFDRASASRDEADPISANAGDYAWQQR